MRVCPCLTLTVFRSNASFTKRSVSSRIACFDISRLFASIPKVLPAVVDAGNGLELPKAAHRRLNIVRKDGSAEPGLGSRLTGSLLCADRQFGHWVATGAKYATVML
jgi:hypothetical protein